jgi:hypothetical protein
VTPFLSPEFFTKVSKHKFGSYCSQFTKKENVGFELSLQGSGLKIDVKFRASSANTGIQQVQNWI